MKNILLKKILSMKSLSKMFDWSVDSILLAKDDEDAKMKAYSEFETIVDRTACFDSFSYKIKKLRLKKVEKTLANKIGKDLKYVHRLLIETYYKVHPQHFEDIEIEGYERPKYIEKTKKPIPIPQFLDKTEFVAGYVLPDGTFYGCPFEGHIDLCYDLKKIGLLKEDDPYGEPDELGWLKVSDLRILKFYFYGSIIDLSNDQKYFIEKVKKLHYKKLGKKEALFFNEKKIYE